MTAAVETPVAHVRDEQLSARSICAGTPHEDSAAGVARTHVARDGPECPGLVYDPSEDRGSDASLAIPLRRVWRKIAFPWRRRAVSHDRRSRSLGLAERSVLCETRRCDS